MNLLKIKECLSLKGDYPSQEISKLSMDSREIEKGDLFIAYGKGVSYIEEAVQKGAVAILTEEDILIEDVIVLRVESVLESLAALAHMIREEFKGTVIAITGSNGKTSTKELLRFLLSFDHTVLANEESENNHLGVPKTLLKLNNHYEYCILEMGMNHPGEIRYLSRIARPNIGIITNIGSSHIGYLGSKEEILKAKMELVDETPTMELFVNGLDPLLAKGIGRKVVPKYHQEANTERMNVELACQVCEFLGLSPTEIERRLFAFPGVKSRMQKIEGKEKTIIDDAYNASLESIFYGLEVLSQYPNRKNMIWGDILELGDYSLEIHQKVLEKILSYPDIVLITVGEETALLNREPHFYSLEELKNYLKTFPFEKGDILYLKASHKIGLSKLVPYLKTL